METNGKNNPALFEVVTTFVKEKANFEAVEERFKESKARFYEYMEKCFKTNEIGSVLEIDQPSLEKEGGKRYRINRVQKTSISFDPKLVKKALGKDLSKHVIAKRYEVHDMDRLIEYLKSCGVDPKLFRSYIEIHETVVQSELEHLEKAGKIKREDLEGTYTVNPSKPYFIVKELNPRVGDEW